MAAYTDAQLILAARLYFLEELSQAQIGKLLNVSQAKVSRMLALARERGLVRITVSEYEPRDTGLERRLGQVLGIEAVVIRSVPNPRAADPRQMIGYFAARPVLGWFKSAQTVAVAGGRTIQALVDHLKPTTLRAIEFVQAMGTIDSSPGPYDAVELGRNLARRWKGTFERLNAPALLPDGDTCARLLQLGQIQHVLRRLAAADLALVGVGTLENSVFVERGVLSPAERNSLREAGVVGEILGRFYNHAGEECATPFRDRVVSLGLKELRKIARRVGVVAGTDRTEAVRAAVRGDLLSALVIDEAGAQALLDAESQDG
jgi:DNA-binding transcriptional regulator LsrR (DeoR family)